MEKQRVNMDLDKSIWIEAGKTALDLGLQKKELVELSLKKIIEENKKRNGVVEMKELVFDLWEYLDNFVSFENEKEIKQDLQTLSYPETTIKFNKKEFLNRTNNEDTFEWFVREAKENGIQFLETDDNILQCNEDSKKVVRVILENVASRIEILNTVEEATD